MEHIYNNRHNYIINDNVRFVINRIKLNNHAMTHCPQ